MVITGLTRNQFAGNRTRVRIPPSPPKLCRKCLNCQVRFRHFLLLFSSFEPTDMSSATFFTFSPFSRGEIIGENGCLFCLCNSKTGEHGIRGVQLGAVVQMGVNICCGRKIAMAEPFLNLLHGDTVCEHQTGTGVPLRYNNDKPEKPRNFKGLEVYQADFSSFSNPKNQAAKPLFRRGC